MIRIIPIYKELLRMEIKLHINHETIFAFLKRNGYEIKAWLYCYEDESFPNGINYNEKYTFTATKPNEQQSEATIFTTVFEREIKELLKQIEPPALG